MRAKHTSLGHILVAVIAMVALVAAAPPAAFADDEGIWSQWASEVTDREFAAEVPIAVLFTLPAMVIITPFWLVEVAIDRATAED